MNRYLVIVISLVFAAAVSNLFAAEKNAPKINKDQVVANLLVGLSSDNTGLKSSSAYQLGEFKDSKSVIPLMRVLRNDKNENTRIIAALSLYKIGTPLSINAVRQAIRFDESPKVQKMCLNFYNSFKIKEEEK
jgi:HEAT repeat protein